MRLKACLTLFFITLILSSCSSTPVLENTQENTNTFPNYRFEVYGQFTVEETCNENRTTIIGDLKFSCDSSLPVYRGDTVYLLSKYPSFLILKNKGYAVYLRNKGYTAEQHYIGSKFECDYGKDLCAIFSVSNDLFEPYLNSNDLFEPYLNSYELKKSEFASKGLDKKGYFNLIGVMGDFRQWKIVYKNKTYDIQIKRPSVRAYFMNDNEEVIEWTMVQDNIWLDFVSPFIHPKNTRLISSPQRFICAFEMDGCRDVNPAEENQPSEESL